MRQNSNDRKHESRGFALIIALGLMAFIMLLLLTTSMVVSLDMASLQQKSHIEEARDNARLGLLVALGELQRQTGPDKRVTATSSIFPDPPGSIGQQQWVGVWDSAAWDSNSPTQQPDTTALFRKWLVSVPEGKNANDISLAASTTIDPDSITIDSDWVALVDKGTLGEQTLGGGAPVEDIVYGGRESLPEGGHYAYWIGDEGVKARYNLTDTSSNYNSLVAQAFDLAAPTRWGIEAVDDDSDPATESVFSAIFDPKGPQLGNTFYSTDIKMTALSEDDGEALKEAYGRSYHDLTLNSMGLLTNTRDGGLKKDLSLVFELGDSDFNSHEDFAEKPSGIDAVSALLYNDKNPDGQEVKHLWVHKTAENIANGDGYYRGPTWHLLRDYYRLYREIENPAQSPTLNARHAGPIPFKNSNGNSISSEYNNGQNTYNTGRDNLLRPTSAKVAPVIARIQLVLSLTSEPLPAGSVVEPASLSGQQAYKLRLIVDPIVTLYNPYSVNLWFQGVTINIPKIVGTLEWEINGVKSNVLSLEEIIGFSHPGYGGHVDRDLGAITGFGTMAIGSLDGITLAPGEVKVYSAGNQAPVAYNEELDAVEGWPSDGGFFVDSLNPDPRFRDATWNEPSNVKKNNYYINELNDGNTDLVLGTAGDTIAVNFEAFPAGDGKPIWVSRANTEIKTEQMSVEAYLLTQGEDVYDDRFKIHGGKAAKADRIAHYVTLRANMELGQHDLIGNIGRRPEDDSDTYTFGGLEGFKQTLGQIDIRLKTEDDQKRPYPMFAYSSMNAFTTNRQSASAKKYGEITPPYAVVREPLDDVTFALQFNGDTFQGFWGPTRTGVLGATSFVAGTDIPKAPLISLGQLQHLDTAIYGYEPSHAIGNSFATPWIELDELEQVDRANIDMSYLVNDALWDSYFFSGITPQDADIFSGDKRSLESVLDDFAIEGSVALPNSRMTFLGDSHELFKGALLKSNGEIDSEAYLNTAASLGVEGAFNVNSTSVEAWKALYSSLGDGSLSRLNTSGELEAGNSTNEVRISRFTLPLGEPGEKWAGYSTLSSDEIDRLAEQTVEQVKKRGPFLSMAQFVNRQISADPDLASAGALQTAINDAQVNNDSPDIIEDEITGFYENDSAALVPVDAGTAGFLTQADLLSMLAPFLSIRSDTFTIRAYGDVTDPLTGKVAARAWCEAIVQRNPEYIVSDDEPTVPPFDAEGNSNLQSTINQEFGRQYEIIGFRWLDKDEV
ncbi:hypothetical protein [Rubellicoccus peritrichatus]|uniref:Uncharacterized protein n=1 Tax=Rubellicoccus peritrichatus TaxID=3080537 RepID=A0AAQ3LA77_9BACT|nr:hypothetical protein [Puniceicoccus sp. CR14]WOO39748.1 hypothetical protein RZN69_14080 [Puniceicoccus sp. CR14]